jgi:hypothetical protein
MKLKLIGFAFLFIGSFLAKAQEESTFTDEELTTYATVMVWAELEKDRMTDSVEYWVKNNETLSAGQYNELSKASKAGDISTVEATEEEVAVFNDIQQKIEDQKAAFKDVYVGRIKEDIGAGLYNRVNKALKSDDELKERYQAIYDRLLEENKPEEIDEEPVEN